MWVQILGGVLAFLGGTGVSALNYAINLRTLKKKPDAIPNMSMVHQVLSVVYFVAAYLVGRHTPCGHVPVLVGAAVGLTIPNILLSMHLAKKNDAMNGQSVKGEDNDG